MIPKHPQRLKNFSYLGPHRYSLRFGTHERRHVFTADASVALVQSQTSRVALEEQMAVVAYCFMPDHLHLLVEGLTAESDCRRFISRAKQYSGFYYFKKCGVRLWQRYGFERVLRENEPTMTVARYILENPIRAGLVQRVDEYPYVGSLVYSLSALMEAAQSG